jgi:transcriptional regulator with XRE-family HTH domain
MNESKSIMTRKLFGLFINEKRQIFQKSLRKFAQEIKISPEYLSKIENGERSAPSKDILVRMAEKLKLNDKEIEIFYDLAAQTKTKCSIAIDLAEYINSHPVIYRTLRLSKRANVSDEEWNEFEHRINKTIKKEI